MRFLLLMCLICSLNLVARADNTDDVKQAYVTYLQARLDRNLPAAQAASTGDGLGQRALVADVERQTLTGRLMDATETLQHPATQPTSRPVQRAEQIFKMMLQNAKIDITADTAKIRPKGAPVGMGYGFKLVNGQWKANLNDWERAVSPAMVAEIEKSLPVLRKLVQKIDAGEFKTADELRRALNSAEEALHGARPTTHPGNAHPSTMPSH